MKIAVTCGPTSQGFLATVEKLLRSGGHEVKRFTIDGHPERTLTQAHNWDADAIWHEWCDSTAAFLSQNARVPVVVRLHRYEADTDIPEMVKWSDRCRLVVTSKHVAARVKAPSVVIPSIVDFDAFPLVEGRVYNPAEVAVVGYREGRKQPGLALAAFSALDPVLPNGTRLRFIGATKEPWWDRYLAADPRVSIEPWANDVAAIWETVQVCLSASADEGCPYGLIEAAASGAVPLVHHYEGAEHQFPKDCLWWGPEDAARALKRMLLWKPAAIRRWAAARYSIEANRDAVLGLFR